MSEESGLSALLDMVIYEWSEIDLTSVQTWLEKEFLKIREWKENSLKGRQGLKLKNKEWRGLPKKERLSMRNIGAVMVQYQCHIDELTKRCSIQDAAILKLSNALKNAPDPRHALQSSAKVLHSRKNTNKALETDVVEVSKMGDVQEKEKETETWSCVNMEKRSLSAQFTENEEIMKRDNFGIDLLRSNLDTVTQGLKGGNAITCKGHITKIKEVENKKESKGPTRKEEINREAAKKMQKRKSQGMTATKK